MFLPIVTSPSDLHPHLRSLYSFLVSSSSSYWNLPPGPVRPYPDKFLLVFLTISSSLGCLMLQGGQLSWSFFAMFRESILLLDGPIPAGSFVFAVHSLRQRFLARLFSFNLVLLSGMTVFLRLKTTSETRQFVPFQFFYFQQATSQTGG